MLIMSNELGTPLAVVAQSAPYEQRWVDRHEEPVSGAKQCIFSAK